MDNPVGDPDTTPRPNKRRVGDPDSLDDGSEAASTSTHASDSTRNSKKSKTSSAAPVRESLLLAGLKSPVKVSDFGREAMRSIHSQTMKDLIARMGQCQEGIRTVPRALSDVLRKYHSEVGATWDREYIWQDPKPRPPTAISVCAASASVSTPSPADDGLGPDEGSYDESPNLFRAPHLHEISTLVRDARRSRRRNDIEAGWASSVHGPLLNLACALSSHRNSIACVNLTHARHLPRLRPSGATLGGKVVDFGRYLEENDGLEDALRSVKPEDSGVRHWNHTDSAQVVDTPLAIAIESKRESEGGIKSMVQIRVWARAHMLRLGELRKMAEEGWDRTICLPLLVTHGPSWWFYIARGEFGAEGDLRRTVIHAAILLGDVTQYAGCFRVVAALVGLVDWAETVYRPWFERWVGAT